MIKNQLHTHLKVLFLLSFLIIGIMPNLFSQCTNSQSSWATNGEGGTNNGSAYHWRSTTKVKSAPDNEGAYSDIGTSFDKISALLYATDFNMNIPCNATIDSITFTVIRRNIGPSSAVDNNISINNPTNQGPALGSTNLATTDLWYESTTDWETVSYTHANWGTTLTPHKVNQTGFGLVISATHNDLSARVEVDAVEMKVCYSLPSTGAYELPIFYSTEKTNACEDGGAINIFNTTGGSGDYEYSIDGGTTWQTSGSFTNLTPDIYNILVRNTDGSCETNAILCSLTADARLLQPGDMLVSCEAPTFGSPTLAIERVPTLNDSYTNGDIGVDVSGAYPLHPFEWTYNDLGGNVQSTTWDQDLNIYTGLTNLYDLANLDVLPVVMKLDAVTGAVTHLDTLPGNVGIGGIEYDTLCNQLFVVNMDEGKIYRLDPATGGTSSVFDPLNPDDGATTLPPLGERVLGVVFNYANNRLYYSMWNSDFSTDVTDPNFGVVRNSIRSVAIDPVTCDFLPATDQLEIETPWKSELPNPTTTRAFSVPVFDIEFSDDGKTMLLAEAGYNSSVPQAVNHQGKILQYTESAGVWTWNSTVPTGNTEQMYEMGESSTTNSRGGVDFALAGLDANACPIDNEQFIVVTMDAALGIHCDSDGCVYGLQYMPISGGNSTNSVLFNISRDIWTQSKGLYGDVDVVHGCRPAYCPTCTTPTDPVISVTDNICEPNTVGSFNITTDCGAGSHIEWSTDDGTTWQTIVPTYKNNSIRTVIARCVYNGDTSCVSANSNEVVSAPTQCTPNCSTPVCDALSGDQIGGVVFEDWNCNGEMDQGSTVGVENIEVKIYDCDNNEVATTSTDSSGSYLFNGLNSGEDYRIEFILPDSIAIWGNPASQGTANATDVQFFTAGTCANFGVSNPHDYCEGDPFLVTPCYINGDPLAGGTAGGEDALVAVSYSGTNKIMLATTDEVGTVWGVAQRAKENKVYSSAVLKRHSGYGPLGAGGIYCSNFQDTTTVNFLDVESIGIDVGDDPRDATDPANTLSIDKTEPSQDSIAFHWAARLGIGDIDFSDDGNTLWLTNLNDRKIYTIDMSNGTPTSADVTSCSLPDPCNAGSGEAVPWGLKYYRGNLYVGTVCNARLSQSTDDLSATIYKLNPSDCSSCEVLSFPLNYIKGHAAGTYGPESDRWYPWADSWEDLPIPLGKDGIVRPALKIYPQPILSDIEFTDNGNMVLGFVDRTGFQVGQANMDVYGEMYNGESFEGFAAMVGGDILRVEMKNSCEGILENNAAVECLVGGGKNNEEGPGGGEFYIGDEFGQHEETALGGLAVLPGSNEVVSTVFDPLGFDSGGLEWLDNTTGDSNMGYTLYDASSGPGYYGKGVGLGDLEIICTACAPLEIGNYVWCDTNGNGLQDACESGVDGMMVQLYDENGLLVGQTTTANSGQYYFNNANVDTTGVNPDGSAMTAYTGMSFNSPYFIVFGDSQFAAGTFTIGTETYTGTTTADVNSNGSDNIDSDVDGDTLTSGSLGNRPDGLPYIAITSDKQGCGNHRYDMGVTCSPPVEVSLTKTVDKAISELDSTVIFTITVYNEGGDVTGATVTDVLPNGSLYITDDANGAYSNSTGIWTIGNMAAGDSAKLNLTVQLTQAGVLTNEAFVTINETETDTTNNVDNACVSIPIELCDDGSQNLEAVADAGFNNYQWYVDTGDGNGYVAISGATQQTLTISTAGSYIYTVEGADAGSCGNQMCCPIIVELTPCLVCPPTLCIPISITKK